MKHSFKQSALVLALAAVTGAAFAQTPSTPPATSGAQTAPMTTPSATPPATTPRMPAKGDTPDAAWRTLDSSNRGYLQSGDLQGSGISFEQADTNKDGRISKEEFAKAWAAKK